MPAYKELLAEVFRSSSKLAFDPETLLLLRTVLATNDLRCTPPQGCEIGDMQRLFPLIISLGA